MRIDGLKVVDAKKPMTLTITKKDVQVGNTKDPAACAAAQCLKRMPEVEQARVHIGRTYLKMNGAWYRFKTSEALRTEIVAFDRGGTFEPGAYSIVPLSPAEREKRGKRAGSNKPGARDKGSKDRTPKKPRKKYHTVTGVRAHGANR